MSSFLSPLCIHFSFSSAHLSQTLIKGNRVKSLWRISFSLLPADTWSTSVFLWCSVVWVLHYIQQLNVLPSYRYIIPLQLFSVQQLWQACPSSSARSAPAPSEVWDAAAGLFIKTHMLTPWQVSAATQGSPAHLKPLHLSCSLSHLFLYPHYKLTMHAQPLRFSLRW